MRDRKEYEAWEEKNLAPFAAKSRTSAGRQHSEEEHPYRTCFQRDRDRIIHSNAFRRLEYKTQVFVFHEGDHYRTRLTHSIEGAQIARTIARALRLNEDLAEAIILAHDLGHTPFGHSGQEVMNRLMKDHGGFEHNRQSLRIVTLLERRYPEFPGLNLTYEVLEGIAKHASPYDAPEIKSPRQGQPTLEAQIVDLADEIAYCSHDLDDGLRSGLIKVPDLEGIELWSAPFEKAKGGGSEGDEIRIRQSVKTVLNDLVTDLVCNTEKALKADGVKSLEDVGQARQKYVRFSPKIDKANKELKAFLFKRLYKHYRVERMAAKAEKILEDLFRAYCRNPKILPATVGEHLKETPKERVICDYIAGMTDRYALEEHARLFDPAVKV